MGQPAGPHLCTDAQSQWTKDMAAGEGGGLGEGCSLSWQLAMKHQTATHTPLSFPLRDG